MGILGAPDLAEEKEPQKKKSSLNSILFIPPAGSVSTATLVYAASWDSAYNDLIEQIREGKISGSELNKDFILKTYDRLNKAAQNGYGKDYYNDGIARKMRENLLQFAATKTRVQQKELQLYSDSIDSKKQYEEEAKKYLALQNGQYLNVQQAWAARSAQSARQWQQFQKDKEVYPCLKVRTMRDGDVRPHHATLEGFVIRIDDPDIDSYIAPFDPNCRCWNEQSREEPTDGAPEFDFDPQWSGNPGRTGEVFNDENSYNQKITSGGERLEVRKQAELTKQYLPYNKTIKVGDNTIYVNDFADANDLEQNIEAARKLAKELAKDIYIRYHVEGGIVHGHKNPELAIGKAATLGDLKTYQGNTKFENFIDNSLKGVNTQGGQVAVLDISKQDNFAIVLRRKLVGGLKSRNNNVQRVILINGNKVAEITRKQIAAGDFSALERL